MIKVLLCGALGVMGKAVLESIEQTEGMQIVCGLDVREDRSSLPFPVYAQAKDISEEVDVAIDFSHASALENFLDYCLIHHTPAVICTTGHSPEQKERILAAAQQIPVFYSRNMSLGINLMQSLIMQAAQVLGDEYDVEISETHHRRKVDAPSGTAYMLAESLNQAKGGKMEYTYDRQSRRQPRPKDEIGISSLRGGTVVGEHSVFFFGPDEVIEIKHTAYSRAVFATGAVHAAQYLCGKPAGHYDMSSMIQGE